MTSSTSASTCAHADVVPRAVRGDERDRRQPSRQATHEQAVEERVGLGGQELPSGGEELGVVLHPPVAVRDPLRCPNGGIHGRQQLGRITGERHRRRGGDERVVGHRVDLGARVARFRQQRPREDLADLDGRRVGAERSTRHQVPGPAGAGDQVQQRVGTGAAPRALEVLGVDRQAAVVGTPQAVDDAVDPVAVDGFEVFGQVRLRRSREATADRGVDVPVERAARLGGVGEPPVVLQQQAPQHRQGVPAHEHAVVVETQRRGDQVDEVVDVVDRLPQRVAELPGGDVLEGRERRTAGGDGVDVAQQPVRGELQPPLRAPAVELAHASPGARAASPHRSAPAPDRPGRAWCPRS